MFTTAKRSHTTAAGAAGIIALAALLAGCVNVSGDDAGGTAMTEDAYAADAIAPMAEEAMPEMATEGAIGSAPRADRTDVSANTNLDRQVIRTGYISMRVEDVRASAAEVRGLAQGVGGIVTDESLTSDGVDGVATPEDEAGSVDAPNVNSYATVTVQVPADRLEDFLVSVSGLGTVDSRTVSARDVTLEVVDLDARIEALSTSITRLQELLARAENVEDLLAVESELSRRQAELDALQAQRTWIGEQVAMSTVTVYLSPITAVSTGGAPGFLSGLQSGWSAFVAAAGTLITAAGFLLPFLLLLAIVALPVIFVVVRLARRGHKVTEWGSGSESGARATAGRANASTGDASAGEASSPSSSSSH
jgi:hypothetical protein